MLITSINLKTNPSQINSQRTFSRSFCSVFNDQQSRQHSQQQNISQQSQLFNQFKNTNNIRTATVLASFVSVALNAAAYYAPACGKNGYFKNYFKVSRFWMIPFCVSSISVACNSSPNDCMLLFPTNPMLLMVHLSGMAGIITVGLFINQCILPIWKSRMEEDELEEEECGGDRARHESENGYTQKIRRMDGSFHSNGHKKTELSYSNGCNSSNGSFKRKQNGSIKQVQRNGDANDMEESVHTTYDVILLSRESIGTDYHQ